MSFISTIIEAWRHIRNEKKFIKRISCLSCFALHTVYNYGFNHKRLHQTTQILSQIIIFRGDIKFANDRFILFDATSIICT